MSNHQITNCDDAIFHINAHFESVSTSCREHISRCESCRREYEKNIRLTQQLKEVAMIDTPDLLEANIMMQVDDVANKFANQQWLAMAASVTVMVFMFSFVTLNYKPVAADLVVQHLDHFHNHTHVAELSSAELKQFLQPYEIKIDNSSARVTHAQTCIVDGYEAAHIVFEGYQESVIMIVLPKMINSDHILTIQSQHYQGFMLALDNGTVALASEDPGSLQAFYADFKAALPDQG